MSNKKPFNESGFSLIEALIAMAIVSFVIVSILSGFAQQQFSTKLNTDKNLAVMMAEMRMEELMKFPSGKLTEESYVDYIVLHSHGYTIYKEGEAIPNELGQMRRTTSLSRQDLLQQLMTIHVKVEYGAIRGQGTVKYPYSVELESRRSIK